MKKYETIYQQLREKYTDEEIADSMLIPEDLSEEEQKRADEELRTFRFKLLSERTEEQRVYSDLLRMRYQLERYIKENTYMEENSFGKQLEEYARILKRTKKDLSEDLSIHYTRFSRIINDREEPNIELTYRLEQHSGGLIPALLWWKLIIKKQEFFLQQDEKSRRAEVAKVRNAVRFRA